MEQDMDDVGTRIADISAELHGESDRASAIVGSAVLDDLLGETIKAYLDIGDDAYHELLSGDNPSAPLSSFGSRIISAYGIGIIDKYERDALKKIKRIRNRFAHDISLSFDDERIASWCEELRDPENLPVEIIQERGSRGIFESTVAFLVGKMDQRLSLIREYEISGRFSHVLRLHYEEDN